MSSKSPFRSQAFTLAELLVVILIITMLVAILLPVLAIVRERANRIKCASNLHQIGIALQMYAQENKGIYPRTQHVPINGPWAFTGGSFMNNVTEGLFLLYKHRMLTLNVFLCPSVDVPPITWRAPWPIEQHNDFGWLSPHLATLQYSYANPYTWDSNPAPDYRLSPTHVADDFALAADRNDADIGDESTTKPDAPWAQIMPLNSPNHARKGQNVLYNDSHVAWTKTPFCGHNRDNIYVGTWSQGNFSPGGFTPGHRNDSVLLPSREIGGWD